MTFPDFANVWRMLVATMHSPAFWFWVAVYLVFCLVRGILNGLEDRRSRLSGDRRISGVDSPYRGQPPHKQIGGRPRDGRSR